MRVARSKKVDTALQFYSGIPLIIIDNEHIKEGIGNRRKGVLLFLCI